MTEYDLLTWITKFKPYAAIAFLAVAWMTESLIPAVEHRRFRWKHSFLNLSVGALNVALVTVPVAWLLVWETQFVEQNRFGLLEYAKLWLPSWTVFGLGLLSLDLLMYFWHRLNHRVPWLWRFHAVHHSDPDMDATTAFRFHLVENFASGIFRLLFIPILGIQLPVLLVYELIFLASILFHHSNIQVPNSVDIWLRKLITTPAVHRVHHSIIMEEHNANYGTVWSFWDRLFGSWLPPTGKEIQFGVTGLPSPPNGSLVEILRSPFRPVPIENTSPDHTSKPSETARSQTVPPRRSSTS